MVVRYSNMINGYSSFNLTKLDVLDQLPELKIATAYEIDGQLHKTFPGEFGLLQIDSTNSLAANLELLSPENVKVQYKTLPGWQTDISKCRSYDELPEKCRQYVEFIEQFTGVSVEWIGVGPARDAMIHRRK